MTNMDERVDTALSEPKGFTVIELLVAFTMFSIVMASAVGLLMSQRALYDVQSDQMALQRNVRAAVDLVASELRSIPTGGVVIGRADSVVVRYPIRWGLVCGYTNKATVKDGDPPPPPAPDAEIYLPNNTDPLYSQEVQTGLGFRGVDSVWVFIDDDGTPQPWEDSLYVESTVFCAAGPGTKVRTDKFDKDTGLLVEAGDTIVPVYRRFFGYYSYVGSEAYMGAQVIAYSTVTYRFGDSAFEPGTRALFRVTSSGAQELSGLFDSDAGFEYVLKNGTVHTSLPGGQEKNLVTIRIKAFATKDNQAGGTSRTLDYDASVVVPLRNHGDDE